jgi:hypothetical protein
MLVWDGKAYTVARWPNEDYAEVGTTLAAGTAQSDTGMSFTVLGSVSGNFANWNSADNALVTGFFSQDWAVEHVFLKSVIPNLKLITTRTTGVYPLNKNNAHRRFFVQNLLEELDAPGEWFIDKNTNILYIYPPQGTADAELPYSEKVLVRLSNARHIRFEGITFDGGLDGAVLMENGTRDCSLNDCDIRHFMAAAVKLNNTQNCGVNVSNMYELGREAVVVLSENFRTLKSFGNYVKDSVIHDFGMVERCYAPALQIKSVGMVVSGNEIYNSPDNAIRFQGNDILIEDNEIYNVCKDSGDVGVIYAGRSFTDQGNVLRYNYIHDVTPYSAAVGESYVNAFYMDDMECGVEIYKNVINNVPVGVQIGGGKNVKFYNNIIMNAVDDVVNYSILADKRGLTWAADTPGQLARQAENMFGLAAWQSKYPWMAQNYWDGNKAIPTENFIVNNLIYQHAAPDIAVEHGQYGAVYGNAAYTSVHEAQYGSPFADESGGDFRLKPGSYVYTLIPGFEDVVQK